MPVVTGVRVERVVRPVSDGACTTGTFPVVMFRTRRRRNLPPAIRSHGSPESHPLGKKQESPMRRVVLFVAVVHALMVSGSVNAQQIRGREIGAQRNGPVAKLIELERRKNEWLRQRFLGR